MFRNYLITALRNLLRNPLYAFINVFGLSIGITCSLVILLFIKHEFSYDRFHVRKDLIYRVVFENVSPERMVKSPQFTDPVGPAMVEEFPEIIRSTRFARMGSGFFTHEEKTYREESVLLADSSMFSMFSFRLLAGDPDRALAHPFSVVISEETAAKIFAEENPLRKVIRWNNVYDLTITGIVETPPVNSHLQFSSLISFTTRYHDPRYFMGWYGGNQYYHYLELLPGAEVDGLASRLDGFMYEHLNRGREGSGFATYARLQPLGDIHLRSGFAGEIGPVGSMGNIYIYSAIALFILFIACINFMNLTTAMSTTRAREVSMRKVFGAAKPSLIRQFLGETILMSVVALILAVILIEAFLPAFSGIVNRELTLYQWKNIDLLIGIPLLIVFVGVLAGSYPAFYLSSFKPVNVLKGVLKGHRGYTGLRNSLVLFQFALSIVLIICTIVIYTQLGYIRSRDPGYRQENIMILTFTSEEFKQEVEQLKERLAALPDIYSSTATSAPPGAGLTSNGYRPEGNDQYRMFHVVDVDYDYIRTMGLELTAGRGFSKEIGTDQDAYLINETLARQLNWDEPVGKNIHRNGNHFVIGVVKDFHFASMHQEIAPLIFTMKPYLGYDHLIVRFSTSNLPGLIGQIEEAWKEIDPNEPFEYTFMDEVFDMVYRTEKRMSRMLLYFAGLAILIACMGLFGLALHNTEQRTREIGIRKVFGSTISGVVVLLTGKYTRWVLLANVLAWPIAYLIARQYMQMYAYHIALPFWVFFVAALAVYIIALLTISFQSIRAGSSNPSDSLRHE